MIVKRAHVGYSRRINLDNYDSAEVEVRMTGDLEPGEDVHVSVLSLLTECRELVKMEALPLMAQRNRSRAQAAKKSYHALPRDLRALADGLIQSGEVDLLTEAEGLRALVKTLSQQVAGEGATVDATIEEVEEGSPPADEE